MSVAEITITLNGESRAATAGTTIAELLAEIPHPRVFALELDGAIVPADAFASTALRDHSIIEIVQFVGGG